MILLKSKSLRIFLLSFFIACQYQQSNAWQTPEKVFLSEIYRDLVLSEEEVLYYKNILLVDDLDGKTRNKSPEEFLAVLEKKLKLRVRSDTSGIFTSVKQLYIDNLSGQRIVFSSLNLDVLDIKSGQLDKLLYRHMHINTVVMSELAVKDTFRIETSSFVDFFDIQNDYNYHHVYDTDYTGYYNMFYTRVHREFHIYNSSFQEGAHLGPHFEGTFTDFYMSDTRFEPIDSSEPLLLEDVSPDSVVYKTQVAFNFFGKLNQFSLESNQFKVPDNYHEQFVYVHGDFENVFILGNQFQSQLYLQCNIASLFDFLENESTGNLILADLIISGKNNEIHWRQFGGFKLAAVSNPASMFTDPNEGYDLPEETVDILFRQTSNFAFKTYRGLTDEELENEDMFQRLMSSYYRIYKVFKDNGQINDANQVYVEMKDVQLRQLRYKYAEYGGLENFIQWRLNQLLRFYTDYGTNPSRAIRISILVVAVFSIFYFFFPSEWDTKSKKQLLADYKILIEKNDHGYFKPFLKLSGGTMVSLINAMTLSLNSFVTLGFGTIPTSGLARYVCILQGFIGWFLLSIFTASLINQVMF